MGDFIYISLMLWYNIKMSKERKKVSISTLIIVSSLMTVVGFIGGTRQNELFSLISPVFGIKREDSALNTNSIQNVYRTLVSNFDGKIDKDKLIQGASKGLVEATGDKYTTYLNSEEAKEFRNELNGDYGAGIGVEIGVRNDLPTIIRPLKNNPAISAGILAGDVVVAVNDEEVSDMTIDQITSKIKGQAGTSVKIKISRKGEEKEFSIVRAQILNPSVELEIKENIAILRISRFDSETGSLAKKFAQEIKQKNISKVIVDLRGNGGGYVTAAQAVASLWIENGKTIVSEKKNGQVVDVVKSTGDNILGGMETVVLADGSSASASEIVAGALQDYGLAKIYGEKTYGKGSVQSVIDLNGGILKVTTAKWFTPNDKNIDGEGISPDKKIELTFDDMNNGKDPQLEGAINNLK